jgi:hypothetical protein
MPPAGEERPTADERSRLFDWIKFDAFGVDPQLPDPGRTTLRRLNRVEYRNTIRDLLGIDYNTLDQFPPDDSGYGFDNVSDVLSVSPLLLEKYFQAAETIVALAVPASASLDDARYRRIFVDGPPPDEPRARDAYARKVVARFAGRAFRRPADAATVDRLMAIVQQGYEGPQATFELAVSRALVAALASPRFVFRIEEAAPDSDDQVYPLVDEYTLASRLSYFLWSTMPDDELFDLAERGALRENLTAQIERMLKDRRSQGFVANFAGQWLRTRDVEHVTIEPLAALDLQDDLDRLQRELRQLRGGRGGRGRGRRGFRGEAEDGQRRGRGRRSGRGGTEDVAARQEDGAQELDEEQRAAAERAAAERARVEQERQQRIAAIQAEVTRLTGVREMFTDNLRRAMRRETEMTFQHVVRNDRSVLELIDGNYTFLNEALAKHYGIDGVTGDRMQRVDLPDDSPRGGLLTQGTILAVTSNPTRTSPVKRGLYILENILGTPAPPPPAPVPPLEAAAEAIRDHEPTLREALELHRREPLCYACHARMDPLGLALENFNALGMWRETQHERPIDPSGKLLTGETFDSVQELKKIIVGERRPDFYRGLTEKMLTYALGRGLEYHDEHTVDVIVARLEANDGRFSALLMGIVESSPFQRQRQKKSM